MFKKSLKVLLSYFILLIIGKSIFGYQILVDALIQRGDNDNEIFADYEMHVSAAVSTKELYAGKSIRAPIKSSDSHYYTKDGLPALVKDRFHYEYNGSMKNITATKKGGFITAKDNPHLKNQLPYYNTISRLANIFHTKVGTNYNGSEINIGYEAYRMGADGSIIAIKEPFKSREMKAKISKGPNPSEMGIVDYLEATEYQFKVVYPTGKYSNGIYYGYHRINVKPFEGKLIPIKTIFDDAPVPGRLYVSAAHASKNVWNDLSNSSKEYTVNMISSYSLLSLPKFSRSTNSSGGGWGATRISGVKKNANGVDTGVYDYEASFVNTFDNIFQLGLKEQHREIYVQHIDTEGNLLPQFKNDYQNLIAPKNEKLDSTRPTPDRPEYHEYYKINQDQRLEIRKSDKDGSKIGERTYTFIRGEAAKYETFPTKVDDKDFHYFWTTDTTSFVTDRGDEKNQARKNDHVIIRLYYEPEEIKKEKEINNLELTGKLCFINELDNSYRNATTGDNLDYVPSTGTSTVGRLTPYINNAYPYVVRGLSYESQSKNYSANATITPSITYHYSEWEYVHVGNESKDCPKLICRTSEHTHGSSCYKSPGKDAEGNPLPEVRVCGKSEHTHGYSCYSYHDGCGWKHTSRSEKISKDLNYTVPYKHVWYNVNNLKMYRLSHLDVYDTERNVGGTLFEGGTYRVEVSNQYERRFSNSSGLNRAKINVTFPSSSYTLSTIYNNNMPKPSGGTSTPGGTIKTNKTETMLDAQGKMDAQTHKVAAETKNLTIKYEYYNDYVQLDSYRLSSSASTSMIDRNSKTWSESIRDESVSERVLDSTRVTGTNNKGVDNGKPIHYTANLNNFMKPTSALTKKYDFDDNYRKIPVNRENGLRELSGKLYYIKVTDPKYNIGDDTFSATDYTYVINTEHPPKEYGKINPELLQIQNKHYRGKEEVNQVNVFTPISLANINLSSSERVDYTAGGIGDRLTLQKNAFFTVSAATSRYTWSPYNFTSDIREFIKGYYYMCNFEIIYENQNGDLQYVPPFKAVYVDGAYGVFKAKPVASFGDVATDYKSNSVKVVAVTKNITNGLQDFYDDMRYPINKYIDLDYNKISTENQQRQLGLLTREDIFADGYHAAYKYIDTVNIGRIFDFAVTDCTDFAFKDVFRKAMGDNVNESTGNFYYSGIKRWDFESLGYNDLVDRDNPNLILPLGPYKHTNKNVIAAPKMGYRISFDLKTTGYMEDDNKDGTRRVTVTPSYYYISKDGTKYIKNIKLFYKNPNGQYVALNGSGYKIYFRPDDGYRYIRDSYYIDKFDHMSKKLESVDITTTMTLSNKMMATNNDSFIQAWYGEYKLPNSTIAVEVDASGRYNMQNLLKDGYIGVIFDIRSIDSGGQTLLYNTRDKSGASTNTSQWDYEGFLKMTSPGSSFSGSLKLEKGTWYINNATYQDIKGTVVLFDLDNRAADDFQ